MGAWHLSVEHGDVPVLPDLAGHAAVGGGNVVDESRIHDATHERTEIVDGMGPWITYTHDDKGDLSCSDHDEPFRHLKNTFEDHGRRSNPVRSSCVRARTTAHLG